MTRYYSHIRRDKNGKETGRTRLSDHLASVANATFALATTGGAERPSLIAGLCHDFGKMTTYFQSYLETGEPHSHALQQHAFISALYGAFEAYRILDIWSFVESWDPLLIYLAIKHHHGDLANLTDDLGSKLIRDDNLVSITNQLADPLSKAMHQVKDLLAQSKAVTRELEIAASRVSFGLPIDWQPDVAAFLAGDWMKTFNRLVKDKFLYDRDHDRHWLYVRLLLIFSSLIDSDKRDAAKLQISDRPTIPVDIVNVPVAKEVEASQASSSMISVRQNLYARATRRAQQMAEKRLFTLTAPTGSGKTLTVLSVAMQLRKWAESIGLPSPRIIYAMPFTSIIDQNYKVLKNMLNQLDDFKVREYKYLIAHHHLAPVKAQEGGRELPVDEALLLQEGWDSEFVITTFVQLFETLIGYRNRALKRFHRIQNAILILDEVQSLPAELWPLIGNVVNLIAEQLGTKIILMTATQPKLLSQAMQSVELAGESDEVAEMFNQLDRIDMLIDLTVISVDQFVMQFLDRYTVDQSYLLVFNTIRTSLDVYRALQSRLSEDAGLTYLSSNVVPVMRRMRVEELTQASRARKSVEEHTQASRAIKSMVIVSTQVVEAGVDLDVDVVYRELAPVDAMVQAAGRCNRDDGGGVNKGLVYVFQLEPKSGQRLSMEVVYGKIKSHATMETLNKFCDSKGRYVLAESQFSRLVDDYFSALVEQGSKGVSEQIWFSMEELYFSPNKVKEIPVVSDFRLIDKYPQYVDLFVTCTKDAEDLWLWYQSSVIGESDLQQRRENYLKRKAEFHGYIISVHRRRAIGLGAIEQGNGGLWYLPAVMNQPDIYNPITGLVMDPNDIDSFI
ncbi:CRISPR-associated helicase Cas3' [Sulfoacidibacillus thermotolerans]|uniref:CRISPR-associated helicase/endonuclease Cas3 n=1 Tax=Sulfoacidibacillus thermotolerans TaxID=1765684 RepID=A0A2U3D6Y4_SULT2|nr:CRISPR-associated helicase Cas3' [Sulfoacidibacillus thermotolerans]PWI57013.1 hypothetical protein BM613_10645 [Sulfoacidibacillus thermotolerans]